MRGYSRIRAILVGLATTATVAAGVAAAMPADAAAAPATKAPTTNVRDACPATTQVRCFAELRTDVHGGFGVRGAAAGRIAPRALPTGYGPATLQAAYKLPAGHGAGETVAVVDAGDDATAEADLAVYRSTYGLPACSTADGCFAKVDQSGTTSPLPPDQGWGVEISLDLDMVSAACPGCHILLVEADTATFDSLAAAENTAAKLGATEISNSYGGTEQEAMEPYAADYSHKGVAVVASSGDYGYGIPNFPAVFSSVIAVGGTSLATSTDSRGWSETAWDSDGGATASGCSAYIAKPTWQKDPNCPGRTVVDVSADADPNTGPAVYDAHDGYGWTVVGGTSAASPFIAGVIALAGNPSALPNASYVYARKADLNDVVGGANLDGGGDCGGDYLCNAVKGYDGPTGLGTPDGIAAF
ncbi:S53 family peptidase [Actinospica sp.]|jgi:subtilase family serine protease|uniref:S53 family peptidase n=1 Tax=Actinospica sp. TaxID=1872142 RepID=UPI002C8E5B5F|nr:S53 family peptidase [Actinospica sp.]HWG28786.1 S53 family peptidase [Actinospica sp.]